MIAEHYLGKLKDRVQRMTVAESFRGMRAALDADQSNTESFDVVLLDLTLPDSAMEETLQALAELTEQYAAKFVVMSSLAGDEIARRALDGGAEAFLAKQDINADNLRGILDEVHPLRAAIPEPAPPASPQAERAVDAPTTAAPLTGSTPDVLDGPALASKIAHDALGWVANVSFRASHLAADPAVQASEALLDDVASLRKSADALNSFISGSRSLLIGELTARDDAHSPTGAAVTSEVIELATWLPEATARWKKTSRDKRLVLGVEASSTVQLRGSAAKRLLAQCLSALLQNARTHSAPHDSPVAVNLREEASTGANVVLIVTDDGGPWQVTNASLLGTPLGTGIQGAPSAGLGLFNARRAIESMGGALTVFERSDAPGAFGIRLVLPRA